MHVVLGVAMRDAAHHLDRFVSQVEQLARCVPHFRVIALLADCSDDSAKKIREWEHDAEFPIQVVQYDTGAPFYPSTDQPERWAHFSRMGARLCREVKWPDDVLIYTYPDLTWQGGTLAGLADTAHRYNAAIGACVLWKDMRYYDIWGTVQCGNHWSAHYPFFPNHGLERMPLVDSVAGCLAVPAQYAAGTRWGDNAERSWCDKLRENGCPVMVDMASVVYHL